MDKNTLNAKEALWYKLPTFAIDLAIHYGIFIGLLKLTSLVAGELYSIMSA